MEHVVCFFSLSPRCLHGSVSSRRTADANYGSESVVFDVQKENWRMTGHGLAFPWYIRVHDDQFCGGGYFWNLDTDEPLQCIKTYIRTQVLVQVHQGLRKAAAIFL